MRVSSFASEPTAATRASDHASTPEHNVTTSPNSNCVRIGIQRHIIVGECIVVVNVVALSVPLHIVEDWREVRTPETSNDPLASTGDQYPACVADKRWQTAPFVS